MGGRKWNVLIFSVTKELARDKKPREFEYNNENIYICIYVFISGKCSNAVMCVWVMCNEGERMSWCFSVFSGLWFAVLVYYTYGCYVCCVAHEQPGMDNGVKLRR